MENNSSIKEYSNGEVTITWEASKCTHSGNCVRGLPFVFDTKKRPWINVHGATTEEMVKQVQKCPSGALGYYFKDEIAKTESVNTEQIVETIPNGPLMVYGNLEVKLPSGEIKKMSKVSAFCRCGGSQNKPFCDGTHKKIDFKG
ncbi:(4Fe-4S)-binding protein [Algoriphagus marinus]|uniref:(4Fe-4S)-binding protein n=1 Tax=Algoriphagus marinus TaxID=1925762 RepID=UPI00094BB43B|nr:(4Fe-4S)-binding protein [Algoriphagus marinus]